MTSPPSSSASFYDILGVSPSASPTTIKRAYQQAALATHPDKAPSIQPPTGPGATMDSDTPPTSVSFHDVQAAWDTLKTPQTRKAYDEQLRCQEREEQGGGFIAEEVRVDEMEGEEGREDGEEGWLVYPCRCGEGFRVRKKEVEERAGGVVVSCDGCSLRVRVHR